MSLKSIKELFDEKAEVVGWLTLASAFGLFLSGHLESTAFLAMWGTGVATFLGVEFVRKGAK